MGAIKGSGGEAELFGLDNHASTSKHPLAPRKPHHEARAQRVIFLFMNGGMSHVDTFDPKPDAGYDYCGPLSHTIPTNVPGIRIGELFAKYPKYFPHFTGCNRKFRIDESRRPRGLSCSAVRNCVGSTRWGRSKQHGRQLTQD